MIDIKTDIVETLQSHFINVYESMPQKFTSFPIVIYSEVENTPYEYSSHNGKMVEESAKITYNVDIYDLESTTESAKRIDEIFLEYGFARKKSQDMPSGEYKRKSMSFSAIVDKDLNTIYFE